MTNRMELLNNIKTNMEDIISTLKGYNIEALFDLYDLKLHEVASINNLNEDIFEFMCQSEYYNFKEYLEENNCITEYVGRTSSFWVLSEYSRIGKFDLSDTLVYGLNYKIEVLVNAFLDEYISNSLEININKDFTFTYNDCITDIDCYDTEGLEELLNCLENCEKDLEEFIEYNVIKPLEVIEYISDFKVNQVSIYNEYAEN